MGHFTDNLYKKNKKPKYVPEVDDSDAIIVGADFARAVRIVSCALMRDGKLHQGFHSHTDLRRELGDLYPHKAKSADRYGFMTSEGNFVSRPEATRIAFEAGQTKVSSRELLSSDLDGW